MEELDVIIITLVKSFWLFSQADDKKEPSNFVNSEPQKPAVILPKYDTIWEYENKKDFTKLVTFKLINVFNEPYQVTMEANTKIVGMVNMGGDRIIIPVEIPENTNIDLSFDIIQCENRKWRGKIS